MTHDTPSDAIDRTATAEQSDRPTANAEPMSDTDHTTTAAESTSNADDAEPDPRTATDFGDTLSDYHDSVRDVFSEAHEKLDDVLSEIEDELSGDDDA